MSMEQLTVLSPLARGNTKFPPWIFRLLVVYPRWRGEHNTDVFHAAAVCGLSPLARGTPNSNCKILLFNRFIPAGAGNTGSAPTT
ncbi:hypothetical protein SEEN6907_18303 [Salmonella enterica subsp. enterica serovar Newport str. VA_R100506907]|nr:hypothetical protein SEEN6907_18303 [Salmonella enterica subsp. enterica serovar Newport str. VA_R100506907]